MSQERIPGYNRRAFLKDWGIPVAAGLGVSGIVLLATNYVANHSSPHPDATAIIPVIPSTPTNRPEGFNATAVSAILQPTATTLAIRGETTSFHPEREFTQRLFDQVRQATFLMLFHDRNTNKAAAATAWLCNKYERTGDYYFSTNQHVARQWGNFSDMYVWRPNIDLSPVRVTQADYKDNNIQISDIAKPDDAAVFRCKLESKIDAFPLFSLDHHGLDMKVGEKNLIVGYPGDFHGNDITTAKTLGEIGTVTNVDTINQTWILNSPTNRGASGSPVVSVLPNGNPAVIGMVAGGGVDQKGEALTFCVTLNIGHLTISL